MSRVFEEILQVFVDLYNQLDGTGDKKLILMQLVDQLEQVKWRGFSLLVERISEDILMEETSPPLRYPH